MPDRPAPPAPVVAALMRAFPRVTPANRNVPYDHRLNGRPGVEPSWPWRGAFPPTVLDPDVDAELRRAVIERGAP